MGLEDGGERTEEEEEEKIPLCESIGHRPVRGRCPGPIRNYNLDLPKQGKGTADHLTLLRLLSLKFAFSGLKSSLLRLQILAFSPLRSRISSWISN